MTAVQIKSFSPVQPTIYCYSTPGIAYHEGWVKIGYTEKQTPQERIKQQTHTAGIRTQLEWQEQAQYKDGTGARFTDHELHNYLTQQRDVEREPGTEWFHVGARQARDYFNDFADRRAVYEGMEQSDYILRKEQAEAVRKTKDYFAGGGTEFLWNAKPRFGKTLAAYDLIRQMGFRRVLVVTNRPSIANSWADDFNRFIGWRGELCFVSELDSLSRKEGVLNRRDYMAALDVAPTHPGFVEFESLQNLKGSLYLGGDYDKLKHLTELKLDLLIVDEAHEGVDTIRTDQAFDKISREHTLYLSGTPFKALADGRFREEQIYNWTYADEQGAKRDWIGDAYNVYEPLPRMAMFTYRLSDMICERIKRGADIGDGETADYAFDLNEFFATNEAGKFIHEEEIKRFLHALVTQEKYPFSTPELRGELAHTLWLLNRVASARALAKLLEEDPVFREYKVVLAAGDGKKGKEDDDAINAKAFDRVKHAIAENEKTITLSVGQLTVGVTIPEWSGVLMLCNMQSPAAYMQAAFRAQNPYMFTRIGADGKPEAVRKETAYVFDFDPARTLIIYDEFANNLSPDTAAGRGTAEDRQKKIRELLNFFPVLGEDEEGRMMELDAAQVLSIPRRIKCVEVVRSGFISNFLFQNISNVFGAPPEVLEIIKKLAPAPGNPKLPRRSDPLDNIGNVPVNKDGETELPKEKIIGVAQGIFGPKIYAELDDKLTPELERVFTSGADTIKQGMKEAVEKVKEIVTTQVVRPAIEDEKYGTVSKAYKNRLEKQVKQELEQKYAEATRNFVQQKKIAETEYQEQLNQAETPQDLEAAEKTFREAMAQATGNFQALVKATTRELIQNKPTEVIERMEKYKTEEEKKGVMDSVRDHLRGFSRTVPSFIMAYGDEKLTLANFDDYTEDEVFREVTGISEEDFRFLRDGGDRINPNTGEMEHFEGHLFDETVFNDSIREFLKKKAELADYFDESHDEDIFDYIPPQKTNQIFTPRWVVKKMVETLEEENPGCFDDPNNTFADLYMKSGLYITEIVKRLYHSKGLKAAYPDRGERIRHILRKQVYGMAPTRIIHLIATNYILGFDASLKEETRNFVCADAAKAAKEGTLEQLVEQHFGKINC